MKSRYRNFYIYSESTGNKSGTFDPRVILQKIGTSKISVHHPCGAAGNKREAENCGTHAGEKLVDDMMDEKSRAT